MNKLSITVAVLVATSLAVLAGGKGWGSDLEKAFADAKTQNKPVLVEFTGSDWCPPCMMMRKKVFTKEEFIKKASEKFILVEIDIPNADPRLKKRNMPLLEKYRVQGVPTVILFGPNAREFDRFGASAFPSIKKFLGRLDQGLARKDLH